MSKSYLNRKMYQKMKIIIFGKMVDQLIDCLLILESNSTNES